MAAKFVVSRSDFTLEAAYQGAEVNVLGRNQPDLFARLLDALAPHGLKLSDMKVERGGGTLAEFHVLCSGLVDYSLTVRVRLDRVEATCSYLTVQNTDRVFAAVIDTLKAVRSQISADYRTFALSLNLHGILEGVDSKEYLSGFVGKPPNMGPVVGTAAAYYFGPAEDRLTSTLTLDVSAVVPGAVYVRPYATWDGSRVTVGLLQGRAETFVRSALLSVGLELPERP